MATITNARDALLYTANTTRVNGAYVSISTGVVSSLIIPKNSTTPTPSSVTLTANAVGYITPTYAWSYRFGASGAFTTITNTTSSITLTYDSTFSTNAGTNTAIQYQVVVTESTSNIGINQSSNILSVPILREGQNGVDGVNSILVRLYARTTTNAAPTVVTAGNSTYTYSSGALVGAPTSVINGSTVTWTQAVPPATSGAYLWTIQVLAVSVTSAYTFANTLWTTPTLYSTDGTPGANTATVYAYKRAATAPTDNPGAITYSFSTSSITTVTLLNSWSKTIPSTGTDPLYVVAAIASSTSSTDDILATEWTAPVLLVKNGVDGLNNSVVFLYARNSNSSTAPGITTTGSCTYTFTTGVLSGTLPSGWTQAIPASSNGTVLWSIQALAISNTSTDTIANTEWGSPKVIAQDGTPGSTGTTGTRGSRQLYDSNSAYNSSYIYLSNAAGAASYAAKATSLIATATSGSVPNTPIQGDTVTFSNGSTYVYTITYNPATPGWETPGTVVDGSLLVTGSVTASKINSNGLSIRDSSGNVILSAGTSVASSTLNIPGTVSNVPAGWQNSNITIDSSGTLQGVGTSNIVVNNAQIEVGGTNVLRNSGRFIDTHDWFNNGGGLELDTSVTYAGYNTLKIPGSLDGIGTSVYRVESDTIYTVSAMVKASANINSGGYDTNLHIQNWRDEDTGNVHQEAGLSSDTSITTSWRLIQQTFRTVASANPGYVRFYFYPLQAGTTVWIAWAKLEKGNKATDWAPNPEEIKNSNITIDSSGTLQGVGTSNVVVNNAFLDTITFITENVTAIGNTIKKTSGTAGWGNAQAYSRESYIYGAYVSFSPDQASGDMMAGLNTDPATNASWDSLDYAWYFAGTTLYIYESATNIGQYGSYSAGDIFSITYDGSYVRYYKNGSVQRAVAATITNPLYFDSTIAYVGTSLSKIKFGPLSSNNWSQITNQPAGIYNSNISINSNGTLSGAGSGTVTLNGMGHNTYRVIAKGSSQTTGPSESGLYINGENYAVLPRSYSMVRIRRSDGVITFYNSYDIYGNIARAAALANDLNNTDSSSVVVVWTGDEPLTNRLAYGLPEALYRCGASPGIFGASKFAYRSAYILIGIGNSGQGNGYEIYRGATDNDINAWCDTGFTIVNGTPNISGAQSQTYIDAGNASTYIANAAIGTAHIANAAITNAQIGNLAVNSANIANLAVDTLKIANFAVSNYFYVNTTFVNNAQYTDIQLGSLPAECKVLVLVQGVLDLSSSSSNWVWLSAGINQRGVVAGGTGSPLSLFWPRVSPSTNIPVTGAQFGVTSSIMLPGPTTNTDTNFLRFSQEYGSATYVNYNLIIIIYKK